MAQSGELIATAASDHKIVVYKLHRMKLQKTVSIQAAHASYISGLAFLDHNTIVSCSHDLTVKVFNINNPKKNRQFNGSRAVYSGNVDDLETYA